MALGATLTRTLQAVITADASRFVAATGQASRSADTLGAKLRRGIGKAAPFAAVGLGLVAFQAKQGVQGVMEDEKALTNLESTLKATGNAANITADGFFEYANQLQATTGVGADQITQGAALLGTFRAVRNEVGKGNQIFTRATEAALDLSKKGFGDLESANKMLGKALQDPTRGITALSRAGVTFSESQKEQIKTLQESGDLLGAQKVILAEVEGQVKGTAKAYGQTTAGQVDRAARAFEELQKALAVALLPVITTLAGLLTKVSGFMQENERVVKIAIIAFTGLAAVVVATSAALKVMAAFAALSSPIGLVAVAIGAVVAGVILLWKRSATFRKVVTGAWEAVRAVVEKVVDVFRGPVKAAFDVISNTVKAVARLLSGDFSGAWDAAKGAVRGVLDWIKATVLALPSIILTAAVKIGTAIVNGIKSGVASLGDKVWDGIKALPSNLLGRVGAWLQGLKTIGGRVISYLASGVTGLAAAAWANITNMPAALLNLVGPWASGLKTIGGRVISYIKSGVTGLAAAAWNAISGFPSRLLSLVRDGAKSGLSDIGSSIVGWIKSGISGAANGVTEAAKGIINLAFRAVNKAIAGANKIISGVNKIPLVPDIPRIPSIPLLARGGIVDGPLNAIVGEAGPEAVIPLSNPTGRRALADALREAGGGAGGGTRIINVSFHGVLDAREAARMLQPELNRIVSLSV
jgi:hypothetical protein